MTETKRQFLQGAAVMGLATTFALPRANAAERLEDSPSMDLGPFYPVEKPVEEDVDLTRLAGHSSRAKGQVLELTGRVLSRDGRPVTNAKVEIWQANAMGRYSHAGDHHDIPLDSDFQGYGVQRTDGAGCFRFLTIKPGAYPASDSMRSPHIHFDVSGRHDRLITQMYFPGEPLLKQDLVLRHDMEEYGSDYPPFIFGKLAAGASTLEPGATLCSFDIVLRNG